MFAALHGAEWVHHPLEKDISAARNAGIDHLHQYRDKGLGWALFLDPDEVFDTGFSTHWALREMATCTDTWGWLFKYMNPLMGGGTSESESIRMSRLDSNKTMRLNGRVHEGFTNAIKSIQQRGEHPNLRYAPFQMINTGLCKDRADLHNKLKRYHEMVILDLEENPFNPSAWVTLGLQYNNDGNPDMAQACFERGVMCADRSYLPFRELALYHMRVSKALLQEVLRYTVQGHPVHEMSEKTLDFLNMVAPGQPYVGTGKNVIGDQPLPDFPFQKYVDAEVPSNGSADQAEPVVLLKPSITMQL